MTSQTEVAKVQRLKAASTGTVVWFTCVFSKSRFFVREKRVERAEIKDLAPQDALPLYFLPHPKILRLSFFPGLELTIWISPSMLPTVTMEVLMMTC
jgi:hypothetical protein